jgi:hypothetical protein
MYGNNMQDVACQMCQPSQSDGALGARLPALVSRNTQVGIYQRDRPSSGETS